MARQLHLGQDLAGLLAGSLALQTEHDVVQHPGPWQKPCILEHDSSTLGNLDVARYAPVEAVERSEKGALAGATLTKDGDELAGRNLQIDPVQDHVISERSADIAQTDDRL